MNVGTLTGSLELEDNLTPGLLKATQAIQQFHTDFDRRMAQIQASGQMLGDIGKILSVGLTGPLVALGAAAIASSMEVSGALRTITQRTGATGETLKTLETDFRAVWATVPESASDVEKAISGINSILRITGPELQGLTKQFLDFAEVNRVDVGESVKTVIQMLKATDEITDQMSTAEVAEKVAKSMDMLTFAAQKSGASVTELAAGVVGGGVAFQEMGFSLDRSLALFAQFRQVGANITDVTSSLGMAMSQLADQGVVDAEKAFNTLLDRIKNAPTFMDSFRMSVETFGAKAGRRLAEEIRYGTYSVDSLAAQIRAADGTVKNAKGPESFTNQIALLRKEVSASLEPIGSQLVGAFTALIPAISSVLNVIAGVIDAFSNLPQPIQTATLAVLGIAAAIGPVILVIGKLSDVFVALEKRTELIRYAKLAYAAVTGRLAAQTVTNTAAIAAETTALNRNTIAAGENAAAKAGIGAATAISAPVQMGLAFETRPIHAAEQALLPLSGALTQTGNAASVASAKVGVFSSVIAGLRLLAVTTATTALATATTILGTAYTVTSGAATAFATRVGATTVVTRAAGVASTVTAAAKTALSAAITLVSQSSVVMGVRITAASVATRLMGTNSLFAAGGITAVGTALGTVLGIGVVVGLFAALAAAVYKVGQAFKDLYQVWQSGGSMWEFFSRRDEDNWLRRWLGLSTGATTAASALENAGASAQALHAELTGANLAKDVEDIRISISSLTEEQRKSPEIIERYGEALEVLVERGGRLHPISQDLLADYRQMKEEQERAAAGADTLAAATEKLRAEAYAPLSDEVKNYIIEADKAGDTQDKILKGLRRFEEGATVTERQLKVFLDTTKETTKAVDQTAEKIQDQVNAFRGVSDSANITTSAFNKLTDSELENYDVLRRVVPELEKLEAAGAKLTPRMLEAVNAEEELRLERVASTNALLQQKGLTLEYIEAQTALGRSEASIARQFGVTTEELKVYSNELAKTRAIINELVQAEDQLRASQAERETRTVEAGGELAQLDLAAQYEAGLIDAQEFATRRVQIAQDMNARLLAIENERITREAAISQRILDQRLIRGEISEPQHQQLTIAAAKQVSEQRIALAQNEANRVSAIQSQGVVALKQMQREFTDTARRESMTRLDLEIDNIEEWAEEQIAAWDETKGEYGQFSTAILAEAQRRKDRLLIDEQALKDNSRINLQQIADNARRTYEFMAAHPEDYSKKTIRHFKQIAEQAQHSADGTRSAWETAYDALGDVSTILDNIPGKFAEIASVAVRAAQSIIQNIASGDWIGAIVSGITAGIQLLGGLFRHPGREAAVEFMDSFDTALAGTGADELQDKLSRLVNGEQLWKNLTQERDVNKVKQTIQEIQDAFAELDSDIQKYNLTWADLADAQSAASEAGMELVDTYERLETAGFKVDVIQERMKDSVSEYIINAVDAGVQIPAAMRPIIESMIRAGKLTDEAAKAILGLRDSSVPSLDEIRDAAGRYGIEIDALGPKVKQLEITELANQYVADWNILTAATDNWGVLIDEMGPKIQDLVTDALRFGSEIPAAMEPMLQAFVDAGELVDENGDKLTDLSRFNFAKPMEEMVDALILKLDELIEAIVGPQGVKGALGDLSRTKVDEIRVPYRYEAVNDIEQPEMTMVAATGGIIPSRHAEGGVAKIIPFPVVARVAAGYEVGGLVQLRATGTESSVSYLQTGGGTVPDVRHRVVLFAPKGTDTVPAMLTPNEGVVTVAGMERLEPEGLDALNKGMPLPEKIIEKLVRKSTIISSAETTDTQHFQFGGVVQHFQTGGAVQESLLTGSTTLARIAMQPDELTALIKGYQQAIAEGFRGTQDEFLRQQLDFYAVLEEGDERLKTWFYGATLDAYGGLNRRLNAVQAAIRPDELQALVAGYQQALMSGFEGTQNQFLAQQLEFYHSLEEGDERVKTFFYGSTLDAYNLIEERLGAAKAAMSTDEIGSLVEGYQQALLSGFQGTQDEFLRQQLDFYHTLEEGDERLKTWFSARTIDAYNLVVGLDDVASEVENVGTVIDNLPKIRLEDDTDITPVLQGIRDTAQAEQDRQNALEELARRRAELTEDELAEIEVVKQKYEEIWASKPPPQFAARATEGFDDLRIGVEGATQAIVDLPTTKRLNLDGIRAYDELESTARGASTAVSGIPSDKTTVLTEQGYRALESTSNDVVVAVSRIPENRSASIEALQYGVLRDTAQDADTAIGNIPAERGAEIDNSQYDILRQTADDTTLAISNVPENRGAVIDFAQYVAFEQTVLRIVDAINKIPSQINVQVDVSSTTTSPVTTAPSPITTTNPFPIVPPLRPSPPPRFSIGGGGSISAGDGHTGTHIISSGFIDGATPTRLIQFKPVGMDVIPAMVSPEEGIINPFGMRRFGESNLESLNAGRDLHIAGLRELAILERETNTEVRRLGESAREPEQAAFLRQIVIPAQDRTPQHDGSPRDMPIEIRQNFNINLAGAKISNERDARILARALAEALRTGGDARAEMTDQIVSIVNQAKGMGRIS